MVIFAVIIAEWLIIKKIAVMTSNITTSAKETLNKQLTRRLRELNFWEHDEAQDIKIIAESYELTDLVNEINEQFYFDEN